MSQLLNANTTPDDATILLMCEHFVNSWTSLGLVVGLNSGWTEILFGRKVKTVMFPIAPLENDDLKFLELVSHITDQVIQQFHPADVFLIRTDQWFDTKWLGFSGKMLGALGVTKRRLTLPPFVPNRILSQAAYSYGKEGVFFQKTQVSPLHRVQPSSNNLTRFIDLIAKSGVFVWFSGDTQQSSNGSLMIYTIVNDSQSGWYASFQKANTWKINKVCGLSKNEILYLMSEAVA